MKPTLSIPSLSARRAPQLELVPPSDRLGALGARLEAVHDRASLDTFERSGPPSSFQRWSGAGGGAPGSVAGGGDTGSVPSGRYTGQPPASPNAPAGPASRAPPSVPGRTPASELNPFDARMVPSSKDRAKSGIQAEVDGKGATLPLGADRYTRLAGIKSEAEGMVGNYTGPDDAIGVGSVAYDPMSSDPIGDTVGKMVEGGAEAAAGGVLTGAVVGGLIGGDGGSGLGAATGFVTGMVGGAIKAGVHEVFDYAKHKTRQHPPTVTPKKEETPPTDSKAKEETPPKEDKAKAETPPKEDKAKDEADPMRGNGHHYEAYRQTYLGHADGTPFGARGTNTGAGVATPRNSNQGRDRDGGDGPNESTQPPSINDLILVDDPNRTARFDARAAQLMEGGRETGRVIITDASGGPHDNGNDGGRPKGNGLT